MKALLSCADFTFPLLPHDAVLQLIRLLELDGVDIGLFEGRSHLQPGAIHGREAAAGREMRQRTADLGLRVSDVFVQTGAQHRERAANHPDAPEREAGHEMFRRAIDFAVACEAAHMTGLPGISFEGVDDETNLARAAEESARRTAWAAEAGLTYGVEAHLGSIVASPSRTLDFLARDPRLSLTLDYGHFVYAGFSEEEIEPLTQRASHFHARGGALRQLQATAGENTIDFPRVVAALQRAGYAGWFCLEYVWVDWEGCNRADNVSETILLRDRLRPLLTASSL